MPFQDSRALIRSASLSEEIISRSKCPITILSTSQDKRLSQVLSVAKETRLPMSLAVVTNQKSLKDSFLHQTKRATFDIQLFFMNGTETEHNYAPVRGNKEWNYARVNYV